MATELLHMLSWCAQDFLNMRSLVVCCVGGGRNKELAIVNLFVLCVWRLSGCGSALKCNDVGSS